MLFYDILCIKKKVKIGTPIGPCDKDVEIGETCITLHQNIIQDKPALGRKFMHDDMMMYVHPFNCISIPLPQ